MTKTNKMRLLLKIILPFLILIIGVVAFKKMAELKKAPQRQHQLQQGILVDITELRQNDHQVKVFATGTVQPDQEIGLVPQVSGTVTWISPNLVAGGFFKKGDLLLKIEAVDYRLAVERASAEVARAQLSLATEKERARVALSEWNRVELNDKGAPSPLVTREIQLQQEEANLAAANANLKLAELNFERTQIRAPFNGRVRSENVDFGQYLRSGNSVATLAGTDRAEIHVPVAASELTWLDMTKPGRVTALIRVPGLAGEWQGKLMRTLGEIDARSRQATLIVAVDDPYSLNSTGGAPLPSGQFVDVELHGRTLKDIYKIPRKALRSNNRIWLADSDNRLVIHQVQVIRREQDSVIIKPDTGENRKLILSALTGVADGTLLRPVQQEIKE